MGYAIEIRIEDAVVGWPRHCLANTTRNVGRGQRPAVIVIRYDASLRTKESIAALSGQLNRLASNNTQGKDHHGRC